MLHPLSFFYFSESDGVSSILTLNSDLDPSISKYPPRSRFSSKIARRRFSLHDFVYLFNFYRCIVNDDGLTKISPQLDRPESQIINLLSFPSSQIINCFSTANLCGALLTSRVWNTGRVIRSRMKVDSEEWQLSGIAEVKCSRIWTFWPTKIHVIVAKYKQNL